ncbi:Connector enhancer of kinase suppressor of ras 1 [Tupaia chinensis]|uniref:Connector enhancer of kinase suppressor of ras 1 n=1 Tax=Tupaia chinensis TaxID=246437 RepID=L9JBA9_TUPCH|nr:Connector enhancer of kinase suppressor of ras 1 [Tupaia chinensis]
MSGLIWECKERSLGLRVAMKENGGKGALRGLDDCLQDYPFEEWQLPGKYLLQLCPRSLEALTVWPLGHQELILDGVEQLRALSSGLQTENLQSLTEGLLAGTQAFQSLVQGRLGDGTETPADTLSAAVELVRQARTLLFWLNRYLFSHVNDFSACQEIGELCRELGQALQEDCPAAEKEGRVLRICHHVAGICHSILDCSPEELLLQRAVLERVPLDRPRDLDIQSTSSCLHFVSRVRTQVPANSHLQIQPGDEVVQINEQVVVGWPHKNVLQELLREPAGASVVLKKIPVPETPPQVPPPPRPWSPPSDPVTSSVTLCLLTPQTPPRALDSPALRSPSQSPTLLSPRTPSEDVFAFDQTSKPSSAGPSPAWTGGFKAAPAATLSAGTAETPEPLGHPEKVGSGAAGTVRALGLHPALTLPLPLQSPVLGRRKSKGLATRLSRRRVSCRQLGRPDCDGWLLLRKAPGGFMGPRWRRCWFVLKGHTLYWYSQPQDEKAAGLINVSNYSLESLTGRWALAPRSVFQLTHELYKPFVFAADTLTDLSVWVRHLITCISKYQSPGRALPPREEDCYSETEAEDPDDEAGSRSASPGPVGAWSPAHGDTSPAATPTQRSPRPSLCPPTGAVKPARPDSGEGALEGLVQGLRQGGVSLLGQPQRLTQEEWRSSFMRRNRDPQLNERVHRVRALQSTLKAKLQELQALEEVLSDPELTGEKFRRWKEQNQELYSESLGAWGGVQAEGSTPVLTSDSREQSCHPLPSAPEGHSPLCSLASENNLSPPDPGRSPSS